MPFRPSIIGTLRLIVRVQDTDRSGTIDFSGESPFPLQNDALCLMDQHQQSFQGYGNTLATGKVSSGTLTGIDRVPSMDESCLTLCGVSDTTSRRVS